MDKYKTAIGIGITAIYESQIFPFMLSSAFSVSSSQYLNYTTADTSGDQIYVFNSNSSAGTITLSGTVYV